jgi:hypothetical protein
LALAAGCADKNAPAKDTVSGTVTLGDKFVNGTVTFIGIGNKEVSSGINLDGTYQIVNPPQGLAKITVKRLPGALEDPKTPPPEMKGMPAAKSGGVNPPAKYASPDNGLKYDVKGGKETYDIKLTP